MPPYTRRARATVAGSSEPLLDSDNPDAILRRSRAPKATKAEAPTRVAVAPDRDLHDRHQLLDNNLDPEAAEPPSLPDSDPWAPYYESIGPRSAHYSSGLEDSSASNSEKDSLAALYKRIGYLPPLDEQTLDLLDQVLANPSMGRSGGRISPSEQEDFRFGLEDRNVALQPYRDAYVDHIESLSSSLSVESNKKSGVIRTWELDLQKARDDNFEPIFQRTVMMSMINRHCFIYNQEDDGSRSNPLILDFAVEDAWKCPPMPSRALNNPQPRCLSQPKPDLAIAFRQYAIFQDEIWPELPQATKNLVCYEGQKQAIGKEARVFHFVTVEAKNKFKTPDDEIGLLQSLNNASQSLHNMYEFFREAGDTHVRVFFDKVRVFSAVSTSNGIKIRIHRACPTKNAILAEDARPEAETASGKQPNNQVPARRSIVPDYPLQFLYDDFFEASSATADFTRENVVGIFEKIIVSYGIGELRGHLRAAAQAFETKCVEYEEKNNNMRLGRDIGYYMHGLPLPPRGATPSLPAPSVHPSQVSLSTQAALGGLGQVGLGAQEKAGPSRVEPLSRQPVRKRRRHD
ncbi:hypothetical protein DL764_006100 [Monosporascus ibericus]|uniref:DUF7924 domain-containing protein n=1 Tax=Monosporascus ibericus TaxID=155417 RepID=A0A4Q4T626_9PEZI|nr:hypothetical protein DL764_006100 [Monosporascus ibericus]